MIDPGIRGAHELLSAFGRAAIWVIGDAHQQFGDGGETSGRVQGMITRTWSASTGSGRLPAFGRDFHASASDDGFAAGARPSGWWPASRRSGC